MVSDYEIIVRKINAYIKKYYLNKLIKGCLLFLAISLGFFLLVVTIEHFGHLGVFPRTCLFWFFVFSVSLVFFNYVLRPIWGLVNLEKSMPISFAAKIIGSHFNEVGDVLLNILQLKESSGNDSDLVLASIEQKTKALSPFVFSSVVRFSSNKKYLRILFFPLFVFILLFISGNKSVVVEGATRVVDHRTVFNPVAPFVFNLLSNPSCLQGEHFKVVVSLDGVEIPKELFLNMDGARYLMSSSETGLFSFLLQSVEKNQLFSFSSKKHSSRDYLLSVLPKPLLLGYNLKITPPFYTKKKPWVLKNNGNASVPEGSSVVWSFNTKNTQSLCLSFADFDTCLAPLNNTSSFSSILKKSDSYSISVKNDVVFPLDSLFCNLLVLEDRFPTISVESFVDSLNPNLIFFTGKIEDDYGFSSLFFVYSLGDETFRDTLFVNKETSAGLFYHVFDLNATPLFLDKNLSYYFSIFDNDGFNGPKQTNSSLVLLNTPSLKEIEDELNANMDKIAAELEAVLTLSENIKKEVALLQKELQLDQDNQWSKNQQLKELLLLQEELIKKTDEIKTQYQQTTLKQSSVFEKSEDLLKKQAELQQLLETMFPGELNDLLKQLEDLDLDLDETLLRKKLDSLDMYNESLEKELDRNLELFKQLDFEESLLNTIKKIDELEKKQRALLDASKNKLFSSDSLLNTQKDISLGFEDAKKDLLELEKKNSLLENKHPFKNTNSLVKETSEEMKKSENSIGNNNKKALPSQKKAADNLSSLSKSLGETLSSMQDQQAFENIEDLRQILENLLSLSFSQEELIFNFQNIGKNDPKYKTFLSHQQKLYGDSRIIEDSLLALSKRIIQLEAVILKEMGSINFNLSSVVKELEIKAVERGSVSQQIVMTSSNNLALLLEELLASLQQDLSEKMPGQQSCEKPGGGSGQQKLPGLKKQQEGLAKKMKELGQKSSKKGGYGGNNEELAKLLIQQEAIRQQIQQIKNSFGESEKSNINELIKDMSLNEFDIMNKKITKETLRRQEKILTRLLEAENAERERDKEEKRESVESFKKNEESAPSLKKHLLSREKQNELFITISPSLSPFYKEKVSLYFNSILNEKN